MLIVFLIIIGELFDNERDILVLFVVFREIKKYVCYIELFLYLSIYNII